MDKAQALQKIPANLHNVAAGLEGCGFDWGAIAALLAQIAPVVADWYRNNQNKMKAASGQGVACPEELKSQLTAARDSAAETLCACCCACHCADCD